MEASLTDHNDCSLPCSLTAAPCSLTAAPCSLTAAPCSLTVLQSLFCQLPCTLPVSKQALMLLKELREAFGAEGMAPGNKTQNHQNQILTPQKPSGKKLPRQALCTRILWSKYPRDVQRDVMQSVFVYIYIYGCFQK